MNRTLGSIRKRLAILGLNRSRNKYEFNSRFFEKIDTPDKAYWLGFIAADGCVIDEKSSKRVKIALRESDSQHLEKFKRAIDGNMPVKFIDSKNIKRDIYTKECVITIYSSEMVKDLEQLGLYPRKTYDLPFPGRKQVSEKLMPHYIRGFIDADGSCTLRQRGARKSYSTEISVVGATNKFLIDMMDFLNNKLNVKMNIYVKRKGNWRIITSSRKDVLKILEYIYEAPGLGEVNYLDRKYLKHTEIKKKLAVQLSNELDNQLGRKLEA